MLALTIPLGEFFSIGGVFINVSRVTKSGVRIAIHAAPDLPIHRFSQEGQPRSRVLPGQEAQVRAVSDAIAFFHNSRVPEGRVPN